MNKNINLVVVVFLLLLILYSLYKFFQTSTKEKQIASNKCFDPEDVQRIPQERAVAKIPRPTKMNFIFVSVASYRDSECRDTVFDLFQLADDPERIIVGVCQQNKEQEEDCFDRCPDCKKRKDSGHIKVKNFEYLDAKGPCFARYQCSLLYNGEQFYLQIDSHTKFIKGWDKILCDQWRDCNDPKAVLSTYPPTEKDLLRFEKQGFPQFSKLCTVSWNNDGLPQFTANILDSPNDKKPVPSGTASAGMLFFPGEALVSCPFDPYLNFLFFGEEILFSARLWTNGYNFYTPVLCPLAHHYGREDKPKFWSDLKNFEMCRKKAVDRVKYILKLQSSDKVDNEFLVEVNLYGLGTVRTVEEYWEYNKIDISKAMQEKSLELSLCGHNDYKRLSQK